MKMDFITNPKIEHYAGENHLVYNTKKQWFTWKCKGILFISHSDYSTFMDYIKYWMDNNYSMTMKTVRNTNLTDFVEWDGDNTSYTVSVAKDGIKEVEKKGYENVDVWEIALLCLEQSG